MGPQQARERLEAVVGRVRRRRQKLTSRATLEVVVDRLWPPPETETVAADGAVAAGRGGPDGGRVDADGDARLCIGESRSTERGWSGVPPRCTESPGREGEKKKINPVINFRRL